MADTLPFDLRGLEIFLAVCDAGTMALAARRLGLTQPAISQAVAELERRTGVALFDRRARPMVLTTAGGALRQRASALLSEARQIVPLLRETESSRLPLLRVGLVDSLSRVLMGPLAGRLGETAEQVSILSGLTAAHASALLTRQIDLLVGADALEELEGLERWSLVAEPYVLLMPADRPAPTRPQDLAALARELSFVRFSARSRTGMEIDRHLRRIRLDIGRRLEFDTPFGVAAALAGGGAFAITTPLCIVESALPLEGLACRPLPGPGFRRQLTLIARRNELGRLPREIAAFCRSELERHRAGIAERLGGSVGDSLQFGGEAAQLG
ncbi:LysR family transcriptional regulator [Ancylobacter terrae]|uniref:LysR family transcriptional regulator n=1 Tax=Ancylobacter sp. sgz301288 TaxID=3342077 RepID=UPI003859044E